MTCDNGKKGGKTWLLMRAFLVRDKLQGPKKISTCTLFFDKKLPDELSSTCPSSVSQQQIVHSIVIFTSSYTTAAANKIKIVDVDTRSSSIDPISEKKVFFAAWQGPTTYELASNSTASTAAAP